MNSRITSQDQRQVVQRWQDLLNDRTEKLAQFSQEWQEGMALCHTDCARQLHETKQRLQTDYDLLLTELKQKIIQLEIKTDQELASLRADVDEKSRIAKVEHDTARSEGEYDWFLAKQRSQKQFQADEELSRKENRHRLQVIDAQFNQHAELLELTTQKLARHQVDFSITPLPASSVATQSLDTSTETEKVDWLERFAQTRTQWQQQIKTFHRSFWIKFSEEHWSLALALLAMAVAAYPLYLVFRHQAPLGIASFLSIGLVTAGPLELISRWVARRTARQFFDAFHILVQQGSHQLEAARRQSQTDHQRHLKQLQAEKSEREATLDRQWQSDQHQIESRFQHRKQELATWQTKRSNALRQLLHEQQKSLSDETEPRLSQLKQQMHIAQLDNDRGESAQLAKLRQRFDQQVERFTQQWRADIDVVQRSICAMQAACAESRIDLTRSPDSWQPPQNTPPAVQFGQTTVTWEITDFDRQGENPLQVPVQQLVLPLAMDLQGGVSTIVVEQDSADLPLAVEMLRVSMLRILASLPPAKVRFTVIDPVGLGHHFSAFMHLADHDDLLISQRIWTEPAQIRQRLNELTQHMENIIQTYLRNEFSSIQQYNAHAGEIAEPFHVVVVANFPAGFTDESAQRLLTIVNSGPRCGVLTLISRDTSLALPRQFDLQQLHQGSQILRVDKDRLRWQDPALQPYSVAVDALPAEHHITAWLNKIGSLSATAARVEVPFTAVAPMREHWWTEDSRSEIAVPLGRAGATKWLSLKLGKGTSQHLLTAGKTGSGKSTLLHAMIVNLALRYSPRELQFYLIDFKKGVEFKPYAEFQLPHARVIAIESEREFGLSVLQRLDVELRRRGDLYRRIGVQSIAGYRDARPDERMPRILLVIDEFQEFFVKEDKISQEASLLLDRLVRQGRAFGIHVVLGSQTLAGAYSLARATIGQMAVRIALQCSASDANLILSDDNDAARLLRRPGEAIYNDENGTPEGNHPFQVVWLSDAEKEGYLRDLQERQQQTEDRYEPPIVFEGNQTAEWTRNELLKKTWTSPPTDGIPLAPRAWVGEPIAIQEAPSISFQRRSGSNLLIVGQHEESALGVMTSSLVSLAAFSPAKRSPHRYRFVVLDGLRPESPGAGIWATLRDSCDIDLQIVRPRDAATAMSELSSELANRDPHSAVNESAVFLLVFDLARFADLQRREEDFGLGSFSQIRDASTSAQFAQLLREGPARGFHTIVWSDTLTNLHRWLDRPSLRDLENRLLFQMSASDSSNLMDSTAASQLGPYRALFYSESMGRADRIRPYGLPNIEHQLLIRKWRNVRDRVDFAADPHPFIEED